MIEKFMKIARVGKFCDYDASGDMQLRKVTLIYGDNGRGKSTLAAILRSLQTGDGRHITERATLNCTGPQEVHLRLDPAKVAKFKNGAWDCDPAAIEIFDVNFVFDNVYVGNGVDHDHKKNLYKVIVGEKGVKLSQQVDALDAQIRDANRNLTEAKSQVQKDIEGGLNIDKFIALPNLDGIDHKIENQERVITALQNAADIATKGLLSKLDLPANPDLAILDKTIAEVSAAAETMVSEHIATNLDHAGEEWIAQGYGYLADKKQCPFCGQGVDGIALIAAYNAHFNQAYATLKVDIQSVADGIEKNFGLSKLLAVQQTMSGNDTLLEFWKRFLPVAATDLTFSTIETAWKDVKRESDDHIDRKVAAPLDKIEPEASLTTAIAAFVGLREKIVGYNAVVDEANKSIAAKKTATATGDIGTEQTKLTQLKNIKARHAPTVDSLCVAYETRKKDKKKLDDGKTAAKDLLDIYANNIFGTYQEQMNKLLSDFGADFQITNTSRSYVGGKASSSYEIMINSTPVPLGDDRAAGQASFRNTLSIGDRSALAMAFFLVKLAHDPDIGDKCIVFDDPVSSLDRFRMGCTVQQILKVVDKAKQVIVLCHDPYCLKRLFDRLPSGQVRAFFLERKGSDSVILEWDIEQATRSQYFQDYFALAQFIATGPAGRDLRDFARKIRPLLEENLRVRFPDEFRTGWLGEFIKQIRHAAPNTPLAGLQSVVDNLGEINDFSKRYHHTPNPSADTEPISEAELKTYAMRTCEFIRGIP